MFCLVNNQGMIWMGLFMAPGDDRNFFKGTVNEFSSDLSCKLFEII